MLKNWQSHQEYQYFLNEAKVHCDSSQRMRLRCEFQCALQKLKILNLDPMMKYISQLYPNIGRPARNQTQIMRSLILMVMLGVTSITTWVEKLKVDNIYAILIGCEFDSLPSLGSYYDFIDRLWAQPSSTEKAGRHDLFPKGKNSKPSRKPGKGKKLPNKHAGVTDKIAAYVQRHKAFPWYFEQHMQHIFRLIGIIPSLAEGLIPMEELIVSGDGTCVHASASPYGHKVCDCGKHGIHDCTCKRHYSDPDADWGWDSDEEVYYYGHTLYMLCTHNKELGIDLPIHMRLLNARRHDSVSAIVSLTEFRNLNPDMKISKLCLDSAHDNYAMYDLCKEWDIIPFIDLNTHRGHPKTIPDTINPDKDGTPLCMAGHRMVLNGYCRQKHAHKWRCPLSCNKICSCACKSSCSPSDYGRVVYTKPEWDALLYPPVPCGTRGYMNVYKNRTACERVNNRVLNDYHLHDMGIHGRKRYSFFTMVIGINIHLDARLKKRISQAA